VPPLLRAQALVKTFVYEFCFVAKACFTVKQSKLLHTNSDLCEFYIDLYLQKKLDLVQNSSFVFAKFRFEKFGPEDRVFGVLSSDVGIA
jgi:hypothetical protein